MGTRHARMPTQRSILCPPQNARRPAASPFYAVTTIPPSFVRKFCCKAEKSHKVEKGLQNLHHKLKHLATYPAQSSWHIAGHQVYPKPLSIVSSCAELNPSLEARPGRCSMDQWHLLLLSCHGRFFV